MHLDEYIRLLGWNIEELARQSGINRETARRAVAGERVQARVARDIAAAISAALGRTVHVGDIEGLNF